MYYGAYRGIRDGAWRCLCDYKIDKLPVDIISIARQSGIRIVKNSVVKELLEGERGKSYYDGEIWVIVYDDRATVESARVTIAHELGHIFLGHDLEFSVGSHVRVFSGSKDNEKKADMFAERILCPSCVLWGLGLRETDDLQRICRVTKAIASKRSRRLKVLYERNMFLTSELEQELYENFKGYIEEEKQKMNCSESTT